MRPAAVSWLVAVLAGGCASPPDAPQGEAWALVLHDLTSNERVEINAGALFHAASVMKVLVLAKVWRDIEDGKYGLDDAIAVRDVFPGAAGGEFRVEPEAVAVRDAVGGALAVGELARWMMVASDNLATNVLIALAGGPEEVTRHARTIGCERSTVARYIMDVRAFEAGLSSRIVPVEVCGVFAKLARGQVVSPRASRAMLDLMAQSGADWLGRELPAGAVAAHKTGSIERTRHDVGLITLADGRELVIGVFSAGIEDTERAEAAIAAVAALYCRSRR